MSQHAFDPRVTEQRNPATTSVDMASPLEFVDLMISEDRKVADAIATQRAEIAQAIELAAQAFRAGGRLIYVGAGTSGRLGVLDAAECPPTFGTTPEMVVGVIAGGLDALVRAVEGAEDSAEGARVAMDERGVGEGDVVVGIAASGTTPFVLAALAQARSRGATTVILACTPISDSLREQVDVAIIPVVGAEVITGSTRLKAGTATKLVLNMVSTGAMVRVGKTLGNLMVDLMATNAKLRDRSERILMELTGKSRPDAAALLGGAQGSVKTALAMFALSVDRETAEARLAEGGGVLRRVVPKGAFPGEEAK